MTILAENQEYLVRLTEPRDFPEIQAVTHAVYPMVKPYREDQLASQRQHFPEGQFVAVEKSTGAVVGMAACLIISWDDYDVDQNWVDFTDSGMFTNHDTVTGRTLYGAEIMVHPKYQGRGVGKLLYVARKDLVIRLNLKRMRAGARLRGYGTYAEDMSPKEYADKVSRLELFDPTLSVQIKQGFRVIGVVSSYLSNDPESKGFAAIIEWLPPAKP